MSSRKSLRIPFFGFTVCIQHCKRLVITHRRKDVNNYKLGDIELVGQALYLFACGRHIVVCLLCPFSATPRIPFQLHLPLFCYQRLLADAEKTTMHYLAQLAELHAEERGFARKVKKLAFRYVNVLAQLKTGFRIFLANPFSQISLILFIS